MERREWPAWVYRDPGWTAALFLFDRLFELGRDCYRFVDFDRRRLDVSALLGVAETWSRDEISLVAAAVDFYGRRGYAGMLDLMRVLDDRNRETLLEAVRYYRDSGRVAPGRVV